MRVWNPDVSFVREILPCVEICKAGGDVIDLADMLTEAFEGTCVMFEPEHRPRYGSRQFKAKIGSSCGMPGAELSGSEVMVYVTKKTASLKEVTIDMVDHTCDLVKHELIHAEQCKMSRLGHIGSSVEGDAYYSDPQEIAAIASEMESQLIRICGDSVTALKLMRNPTRALRASDRYNLYTNALKEDPVGFRKTYNRMMAAVAARLTQGETT